jgi:hypothetical protein
MHEANEINERKRAYNQNNKHQNKQQDEHVNNV